jgi:hypothetical protein
MIPGPALLALDIEDFLRQPFPLHALLLLIM